MSIGDSFSNHYASQCPVKHDENFKLPSLMNRCVVSIAYSPISPEVYYRLVIVELKNFKIKLKSKGIHLKIDASVRKFLFDKGNFDLGITSFKRVMEQYLDDPLTEKRLLYPEIVHYEVQVQGNTLVFDKI